MRRLLLILTALLPLADPCGAQIKPGEWNGEKPGRYPAVISITLFESGEADFAYSSLDADVSASGTWSTVKDGKFAGDALLDLRVDYIKNNDGQIYGEGKAVAPIYLGQSGDEAFILKGLSIGGIEIDISFPLRHTGHRHIRRTEGNH